MILSQISLTRSELLETRKKLVLAKKGYSLLKKKQDVLIDEFFKVVKEYRKFKQDLKEKTKGAYHALSIDLAYTDIAVTKSISFSAKEAFDLEIKRRNIMGVRLPAIETIRREGYFLNTYESSPQLKDVADKFKDLFEEVVKLSVYEMTIQELSEEIKKLKRRVNFLENIQIPKLEEIINLIKFVLEEQERENFTRLKMIKQRLEEAAD